MIQSCTIHNLYFFTNLRFLFTVCSLCSEIGLKSVVDIVKDIGDLGQDGTPQAPPSTPTNLKGPTSVGDAPEAIAQVFN
jgi:hypothetical protein